MHILADADSGPILQHGHPEVMEPWLSLSPTCMSLYEQLVTLFHHHLCEECEETDSVMHITLPLCHSVEAMLSHFKYCRAGMSCKIPYCRDSRIIVSHGKVCRTKDCPVVLSFNNKNVEWTQTLLQQIGGCSSCAGIQDLEDGDSCQLLCVLFHIVTYTRLRNHPKDPCMEPECRTVMKLLAHSQLCADRPNCQYPGCTSLEILLQNCHTFTGETCVICHPLQSLGKYLYFKILMHTPDLQNVQMSGHIPNDLLPDTASVPDTPDLSANGFQDSAVTTRSSPAEKWENKSRKSWRSWKRCEGLWIRRHPYRKLECKSRPAPQQNQTRGHSSQIPFSM